MNTIYRLRDDATALGGMQQGSLSDEPTGLRVTHGLIGSPEWWECIANGTLQARTVQGVISGFWPGQWGDGPAEFEMKSLDGESSHWLCELESRAAKRAFCIGALVAVEYVEQTLKTAFNGSTTTKVVLSISVE